MRQPGIKTDPHVVIASVVANLLAFALPLLMLQIYDRVIPRRGIETLVVLAIGVVTAIVLELIMRTARAQIMSIAADAFERNTLQKVFERLLKSDVELVERTPHGDHIDRISSIDRVRDFRHGDAAVAVLDLPFALLFGIAIAIVSPVIAVVVVVLLLVSIGIMRLLHTKALRLSQEKHEIDRRRHSFLIEALNGIEFIKSSNIEAFMERRYERLIGSTAKIGAEAARRANFAQSVTGSIGQLVPVVVAGTGAVLVIQQSMTVGALAAAILLASRIVQPFLKLEALRSGEQDTQRSESDLTALLNTPLPATGQKPCQRIDRLALRKISFAPGKRKIPLFKELDLEIARGEIITIDGCNGAGRSTLLWLAMGFFHPDAGQVLINGTPIGDIDPTDLRRRIGYLPPRPRLLEGTVLENMTRFQPGRYLEDALDVAMKLGLESYFAAHQEGLGTKVGHGLDAGLPTSVAERVPLVGALVGQPDLVFFDEANANLDMEGDACLRNYLASLKGRAAVILVTQRPSYLNMADRHYKIENGRLLQVEPEQASAWKAAVPA